MRVLQFDESNKNTLHPKDLNSQDEDDEDDEDEDDEDGDDTDYYLNENHYSTIDEQYESAN
jgi:hypothetical protein